MIQANQTVQLEKDFLSCGSLSEKNDQMVFVTNLANIFKGVVQFNNKFPGINIQYVCKQMTKSDDSYKNLQMVYKVRSIALIVKLKQYQWYHEEAWKQSWTYMYIHVIIIC